MLQTLGFRVQALALVGGLYVVLLWFHFAVLPRTGGRPDGIVADFFSWSSVVWLLPVLFTAASVVGLLIYRRQRLGEVLARIHTPVSFRIVSRGFNIETLHKTIASVRSSMCGEALFPYVIEVVTDGGTAVPLPYCGDLRHIVVPRSYRTKNGTLFKARALHYALEKSALPDEGWIVHLDEESCITPSFVVGLRKAIEEEERSGKHRIGTGVILYHHSLEEHPFFTLAESMRSGEDAGRTHLQQRLGFPVFGLHGSALVMRNSVEKEVGFDFGPGGSITEDAFMAMAQMQRGRRGRWIEGYVVEQAAFTFRDYLRQRRRWFIGIAKTAMHAPVSFRYRAVMTGGLVAWAFSWASVSYTACAVAAGVTVPWPVVLLADFTLATYISLYLIGLKLNLEDRGGVGVLRRVRLYVAQVICIPIFSLIEAAAIAYGLVRPNPGFHVIKK